MILVIGSKRYPSVTLDELSIRHTLELQRELTVTNISSAKTWSDVRDLLAEYYGLPDDAARAAHPEMLFLTAVTIWAARVASGETLSLLDAVDVPAKAVRWVEEPADRLPAGKQ